MQSEVNFRHRLLVHYRFVYGAIHDDVKVRSQRRCRGRLGDTDNARAELDRGFREFDEEGVSKVDCGDVGAG